jgi:hypothetical protein
MAELPNTSLVNGQLAPTDIPTQTTTPNSTATTYLPSTDPLEQDLAQRQDIATAPGTPPDTYARSIQGSGI